MKTVSQKELQALEKEGAKVKRSMGDATAKPIKRTTEKPVKSPEVLKLEKRLEEIEKEHAELQKALINSMKAISLLEGAVKTLRDNGKEADQTAIDMRLRMAEALNSVSAQKVTTDRVPWVFDVKRHHNSGLIERVVAKPQEK